MSLKDKHNTVDRFIFDKSKYTVIRAVISTERRV